MTQFRNSSAGTPRSGRTQVRIGGLPYYLATPQETGQTGSARQWMEKRESSQQVKAQPFTIMLDDLSQGAGFSYAYDKLPQVYAWSHGWDAWAPGIISTRASLTTGDSFTTVDARGWQLQLGNYLYCMRGRYVVKYAIAQGSAVWPIVEIHDVDGTTPTGKVVTGRPEVFKGKIYVPIRTGVAGALTVFQELTTQVTTDPEVQTIAISGTPTSGTYTITYDGKTTAAIAYNAISTVVQAALRLIPGLEAVTVAQSGSTPNFTHTVTMTGVGGVLGASSPSQMTSTDGTSGGTHAIAHATTHAGTCDTWTAGAANCTASSFRVYGNRLAKAGGSTATTDVNRVYFCQANPMVFANWAPSAAVGYEFGDYGNAITDMAEFTPYLPVGKSNGVYTLDESYQSHNAIQDFHNFSDATNCIGMEVAQGEVCIPYKNGLIVWDGNTYDVVGLGQEGFFNAAVDRGEGRFFSIAPAGDISYYVANDTYGGYAIFGSFRNPETRRFSYGGASRAKVWQTYEVESGARYENVILLSTISEPAAPKTPSTISDDSAVGTITWSNTGNVTALDAAYATAAAGTSHYLKALNVQPNVPTGATVTGVQVEVAKKAGGSLAATPDVNGYVAVTGATSYANMQAGTGTLSAGTAAGFFSAGQDGTGGAYQNWYGLVSFDTSAIPDTATVVSATLVLTPVSLNTLTGTLHARVDDFGGTITTADYVTATAAIAGKTLAASVAFSQLAVDTPITLTSETAFASNVNKTGSTRLILTAAEVVAGTTPTTNNIQSFYDSTAGTAAYRPTLTVTYTNGTVDNVVKLVVGGSVVGTNLADTSTVWPTSISNSYTSYGGANNLWGTSISVAQANASDFGVVVSATVGTGDTASIDHIRMTVFYTAAGQSDTATLLSVLHVDSTRTIAYPVIYQLPRNGQRATYDPQLAKARTNATFQTSRYHAPGRNVQKVYDTAEFYAEMSAPLTSPGLFVKYSLNDTDWDYLLNSSGGRLEAGAELGSSGKGKVVGVFPRTSASWGSNLNLNTVALQFYIPTATGGQVASSAVIRDIVIQGWFRPTRAGQFSLVLLLGEEEMMNQQVALRTIQAQQANLRSAVEAANYPVAYQSPDGRTGYAVFEELEFHEGRFFSEDRSLTWPQIIATITGTWLE